MFLTVIRSNELLYKMKSILDFCMELFDEHLHGSLLRMSILHFYVNVSKFIYTAELKTFFMRVFRNSNFASLGERGCSRY